jgi:predicted ATPase/class 3 adenylate cyclase
MAAQLTFLFTDLEGSTHLWQQAPMAMQGALARHDAIMKAVIEQHNGRVVKSTGDGLLAVFESAVDGALAALSSQQAMAGETWPVETGPLKIRVGLHSGESQERGGDYFGTTVNTAARVMDLGHGGQILVSEVTALILRGQTPADISFTDLGAYRLKGLALPENVYQLSHPSLAQEFPPLRSSSIPKHNLPAEITPLVGREQEINALSDLLADPKITLVSIIAPGGTGKSHLAVELGRRMVKEFENGVYFVELAPINESDNIVPAVAEAAGYQFQQNGRGQKQQILDYLANKEMLLIMDNYEHLLDGGAALVTEMLRSANGLKVVTTSRYRLHLPGETLFTLHGLDLPDAGAEDAMQNAAVAMFQQSAQRARPDFELTSENLADVVQICRLVQGMPLGILLAAAWVSVLSLAEIVEEIQQGLDILEAEGSELPERQRSVRAVFEQAWGMMNEAEQDVFMKTAVFRGGFTRKAAQEVAGAGLRQLQSLVNKALLEHSVDQGRFLTHELLRQFAEEKLGRSGEAQQVRSSHCAAYLTFLAQQTEKLKGSQQLPALTEIEEDFDNIRAAWEYAARSGDYGLIGRALEPMYLFCFLQSRLEDGKALFEKARQGLAPGVGAAPHPVWLALGIRFYSAAESQAALKEQLETSLLGARERGDELEAAYCLQTLASLAHYVDQNPPQAVAYYEESAAIYRRLGEHYYLAQTLSKLGEAHQLLGQTELTLQYVREAYELQRRIGDYIGESETLRALSMTAWQTGSFDEMVEYQEKAYAIQLQTNYIVGQATSNLYLGDFKFFRGAYEEGLNQVQLGLEQAIEVADFSTQAWCHAFLSLCLCARGDYAGAREELGQAEAITTDPFRQTGGGNPFLALVINLAHCLLAAAEGNFGAAKSVLLQPLSLTLMTASQGFMTMMPALAAPVFHADGHPQKAAELLGRAFSQQVMTIPWLKDMALFIDLQSDLQKQLGAEEFAAAWERGQAMDLMDTTRQILHYLEANHAG